MRDVLLDTAPELLTGVFYAIGTAVLTLLGIEAELFGVHRILAGDPIMALWFAVAGALAIYVGVFQFGAYRLVPTIRDGVLG